MTRGWSAVGLLGALLVWPAGPAAAQTADTPRTPWGAPDLGGVWDYRSATPMARPDEYGDRAVMTEEEAAALARRSADLFESIDNGETVPGHEIHTRVFLDFGTEPVPDRRTSLIVDPPNGRHPPAVEGADERRAAVAGSFGPGPFDSWEDLNLMDRCLGTIGFPIVPGPYNNNVQVFQTPDHVVILAESMHFVRIIPSTAVPAAAFPSSAATAAAAGRATRWSSSRCTSTAS